MVPNEKSSEESKGQRSGGVQLTVSEGSLQGAALCDKSVSCVPEIESCVRKE
mgnify:FL=1